VTDRGHDVGGLARANSVPAEGLGPNDHPPRQLGRVTLGMSPSVVRWLGGLLVSVTAVAAVTGIVWLLEPHVPVRSLLVLYILAILPVAVGWGTVLAAFTSVLGAVCFAFFFLPPIHSLRVVTSGDLVAIGVFLVTAVVVGELAARSRREALDSARLAEEQSALRRVATLVAQAAPPSVIADAVTREVGLLCDADVARMERYDDDDSVTGVARWSRVQAESAAELALGTRFDLDGVSIARAVRETGRPTRVDTFGQDTGAIAREARAVGIRSSVGCPIVVGGRIWGVIAASTKRETPFPRGTEAQIGRFTELIGTAIANAQAQAALTASRARIAATADETRRRIERDLHDGAQQRLVSMALRLRGVAVAIPPELDEVQHELADVGAELDVVMNELRELSRGIHPAILSKGGLDQAMRTLARRSSVPVELHLATEGRLPERIEVTAYYVVSEALTNVAKHANAAVVDVRIDRYDGLVRLFISDDGVGGADPVRGSGLVGLKDRVEASGGTLQLESRAGQGTSLLVKLPVDAGHSLDPS
jgi:signal transduction histidine kinase